MTRMTNIMNKFAHAALTTCYRVSKPAALVGGAVVGFGAYPLGGYLAGILGSSPGIATGVILSSLPLVGVLGLLAQNGMSQETYHRAGNWIDHKFPFSDTAPSRPAMPTPSGDVQKKPSL